MTTASEPVIIEGETAETGESNEIDTEETPAFRDEQEERALTAQDTISAEMGSYWESIILTLVVIGGTIAVYFIIKYFIIKVSRLTEFR